MENRHNFLLCFSLGILLLLLGHVNAEENRLEPRKNPNLSPFEQWRSAYFCLHNLTTVYSNPCESKDTLTLSGKLSVLPSEIESYCDNGCYVQTKIVMQCIQDVHRHFKFETGAPVSYVWDAIVKACSAPRNSSGGINTTDYKNDPNTASARFYGRLYLPLLSTLITLPLLAAFA